MDRRLRAPLATAMAATLALASAGSLSAQSAATAEPDPENQPTISGRVAGALDELSARIAGDPEAALTWVRERVRTEPYDGVMKGAAGTLLTGGGNGADQALLLQALLGDGVASRFATCELDEAIAAELAASWAAEPRPSLGVGQATALAADVEMPELGEAIVAAAERYETRRAEAEVAAVELTAALEASGWTPASVDTVPRTHVWLEVERDGAWQALDPTTTESEPPCAAEMTFEELPAEMGHRLDIAVVAEVLGEGGTTETTLLETSSPTAALATARIAFAFGEVAELLDRQRPSDARWPYTPVLRIDNQTLAGQPVELPPMLGAVGSGFEEAADALGGLGGALGDALGGGETADGGVFPDDLAAVWLDLTLQPPAGEPVVLRSEVFDRIGIEARAAGELPATLEPLEVIAGEYAVTLPTWQIGLDVGPVAHVAGMVDGSLLLSTFDGLSGSLDALLRTFPSVRLDAGGEAAERTGPGLVLAGMEVVAQDDGTPGNRLVFDALHVPGLAPGTVQSAAQDAYSIMLAEGVMAELAGAEPNESAGVDAVLRAASAADVPLVGLAPGADVTIEGATPEAIARIEQRLTEGFSVLTPSQAVERGDEWVTGWLAIDSDDGRVRDQYQNGRHADLTEEGGQQGAAMSRWQATKQGACRLGRLFMVAGAIVLMPIAGPDAAAEVVEHAGRSQAQYRRLEAGRAAACSEAGTPSA